jgi:hypothetical protein
MQLRSLARGLALNRIQYGAGLTLAPGLFGKAWLGSAAEDERTKVFGRALGARDLALGVGALLALDDADAARRWFAGHALADAADLVATLVAGHRIPTAPRLYALTMAAGSTAIAVAYAVAPDTQPATHD